MNEEKESNDFRSKLQKVELDKPSGNFSSAIMKEIEDEPKRDSQLQSILSLHAIEQPSAYFTENVMHRVKTGEFESSIRPVISRKTWAFVAVTSVVLSVWILLSDPATPDPGLTNYLVGFGKKINILVSGTPLVYLITFFAVSALVIGDYAIRTLGSPTRLKTKV